VVALHFLFLTVLAAAPCPASEDQDWERYSSENFTLVPREGFQFRVTYDQIPVRTFKLVVTGNDDHLCDLSVLRVNGEELLYFKTKESRHEVEVPWGIGEELLVSLTNRKVKASFVVELLGPRRDQVYASYSYHVNRALEFYAAGRRLAAEESCRRALDEDPSDGVAKVLLAGFLRDRNFFAKAATLVEQALADDLTPEMRQLALDMRSELADLRAPLAPAVREGVERADDLLMAGDYDQALVVADGLLAGDLELDGPAKSRLQAIRGRSLDGLGRNFEAIDAFTLSLQLNRSRAFEAVIYFHMGNLYLDMGNLRQAEGAFTIALQNGLPSGLDVQARETLKQVSSQLADER
jgi:tetratricopeptide (TPR) repeat protein